MGTRIADNIAISFNLMITKAINAGKWVVARDPSQEEMQGSDFKIYTKGSKPTQVLAIDIDINELGPDITIRSKHVDTIEEAINYIQGR